MAGLGGDDSSRLLVTLTQVTTRTTGLIVLSYRSHGCPVAYFDGSKLFQPCVTKRFTLSSIDGSLEMNCLDEGHPIFMANDGSYPSNFLLLVSGQIESAEFYGISDVYCRYCFAFGEHWNVVSGVEEGLSQLCCRNAMDATCDQFVLNFPIDLTFRSTNPYGWPRLTIACYGSDWWGNDVIRGYGFTHVPTIPGRHTRKVAMFVPKSSSKLKHIVGWLLGRRPEFVDPCFVAQSDSRDLTRVVTTGTVTVTLQVIAKGLKKLGYDTCKQTLPILSEFPWKRTDISRLTPAARSAPSLGAIIEADETERVGSSLTVMSEIAEAKGAQRPASAEPIATVATVIDKAEKEKATNGAGPSTTKTSVGG
uniref:B9 domain-containing protein 1 n=1 Tax=Trichuris muris TaxID=70415 RepID=A0A5S6QXM6_TRIMR